MNDQNTGSKMIQDIQEKFDAMMLDMNKAYTKEQVAAARRARTASVELTKMLKHFRQQSLSDIG